MSLRQTRFVIIFLVVFIVLLAAALVWFMRPITPPPIVPPIVMVEEIEVPIIAPAATDVPDAHENFAHDYPVPDNTMGETPPPLPLPVEPIAGQGWRQNAIPFTAKPGVPKIVIILDDMGLDIKHSNQAIGLPAPLTLSYMTYAENLAGQTGRALAAGHELMMHVPMQPMATSENPGPHALLATMDDAAIQANLNWALARFTGYVGINNHMGSRFTSDAARMAVVAAELKRRDILFVDSKTIGSSKAYDVMKNAGVAALARDVFLDDVDDIAAVRRQLQQTEYVAQKRGMAIAIGHPRPATLQALREWLPTLAAKNIQLAPVSAVVNPSLAD